MATKATTQPRFPSGIETLIADHHRGGIAEADCEGCNSACCAQAGFAILENVLLIYERYRRNELQREDHAFEAGQSFGDFVRNHFDVYRRSVSKWWSRREILVFHVKSLSPDGHPISIPPVGRYYDTRDKLLGRNPWLNAGCIFLSRKLDPRVEDRTAGRRCILHQPNSRTHLTTKPIDCVFHTCTAPGKMKLPTSRSSREWLWALADAYPLSEARFDAFIRDEQADRDESAPV